MKNSTINTVKSVAVDTVKVIVYPAHLVLQTSADLLNIGQAQAIKAIDGTPLYQSLHDQATWTQEQQAKVVTKFMAVKERIEKQREYNRQQDIARLQKALDKAQGVEHVSNNEKITKHTEPVSEVVTVPKEITPEPVAEVIKTDVTETVHVKPTEQVVVPAPPATKAKSTKAKAATKAPTVPLMTAK